MHLPFSKYHGTGNDFILVDGRLLSKPLDSGLIALLCHRHMGIGADGLIIVKPSADLQVDYIMEYFNADGKEGSMCGNGARCAFQFAQRIGLAWTKANFLAYDGRHEAQSEEGNVSISMRDVSGIEQRSENTFILDTGSPHFVRFVDDVGSVDVFPTGREIRFSEEFNEKGINVNFAQSLHDAVRVRTYERGVEDITMSCGTGVAAVALAFALKNHLTKGPLDVIADGGRLVVNFEREGQNFVEISLKGPVVHVFDGSVETDHVEIPET